MDVACFTRLPVGVVLWAAPEPALTVVVKATFALSADGKAVLAPTQEPLRRERRVPDGEPGELDRPSDFVPRRGAADVLLVGHAHASRPATSLPFRIQVAALDRRLEAVAPTPTTTVPLLRRHLRDRGQATQVGPRPVAPSWGPGVDAASFDFALCNAAPPGQRVALLPPGGELVLEGLLLDTPIRRVLLPSMQPVVYHVASAAVAEGTPVALTCDTLLVDTRAANYTLTWRGTVARHPSDEGAFLVLAMQARRGAESWQRLARQLDSAEWVRAAEETDDATSTGVILGDDAPREAAASLLDDDGLDGITAALHRPTSGGETVTMAAPTARERSETRVLDASTLTALARALPFDPANPGVHTPRPGDTEPPPVPTGTGPLSRPLATPIPAGWASEPLRDDVHLTVAGSSLPAGPALPFDPSKRPSWLGAVLGATQHPPDPRAGETLAVAPRALFEPEAPPWRPENVRPVVARAPAPPAPETPAPSHAPVASEPAGEEVASRAIATYARVRRRIWSGAAPHAAAAEEDLSETEWRLRERYLVDVVAERAAEGDAELLREVLAALRRVEGDALADDELPTEEKYAELLAEMEADDNRTALLARRGIPAARWQAIRARFDAQAHADSAFAERLRALVERARRPGAVSP